MVWRQSNASHGRRAHELLFSLNLGLGVSILVIEWEYPEIIARLVLRLRLLINASLQAHGHTGPGDHIAFLTLILSLAACAFLLLRLSSRTFLAREVLCSVAIVVALAAPFACWIVPLWPYAFEAGEVGVVTLLALLYSGRPRILPVWGSVVALVLHFSFWFWLFWRDTSHHPVLLAAPIVGLLSGLAWVLYVSGEDEAQSSRAGQLV
jgi:hypothetical protein